MGRHRSSLVPLALLYGALIVYASLYPFRGWTPAGQPLWAFVLEPWPRWWTGFDLVSNLLGYVPLGALVAGAALRSEWPRARAFAAALAVAAGLSGALETLQNFLPARVPSNLDWGLNVLGAAGGALFMLGLHGLGLLARAQSLRERWFIERSAVGLTLLLLWPAALLFPTPAPLGVGQVADRVDDFIEQLLQGTALEGWIHAPVAGAVARLPAVTELVVVALGVLAPCLLAFAISPPRWPRLVLVAGAAGLGFATTTLSTALSYGPQHALAWITPATPLGLAVGTLAALVLAPLPMRAAAAIGLVVLTALAGFVNDAPADPYYAQSLAAWEQGRFIRFHGLAQWVGWLWPYAVLAYLVARVASRERPQAAP
jgi:VanZ family protein